jgi:putative nucleotidyltransferase with HDIG domain
MTMGKTKKYIGDVPVKEREMLLTHLSIDELISKDPLWEKILAFIRERETKTYLVGGYLRDLLIGRASLDIDLVTEEESLSYARDLAARLEGSSFLMDEAHRISRIVLKEEAGREIDVSTHEGDIISDLKRRDFTVDSLALDLGEFVRRGEASFPSDLIDPLGGWGDLQSSLIRMNSESVFGDDPLRLIRALRLSSSLGFILEENTADAIRRDAPLLQKAAGERVRDELFAILNSRRSAAVIEKADDLGLIREVIEELEDLKGVTQNAYHHLDVWKHSLLTLEKTDEIVEKPETYFRKHLDELKAHLREQLEEGISRASLLKFACLLHDIGKPKTRFLDENCRIRFFGHPKVGAELAELISQRFRLSKRTSSILSLVIREHMRPGFLVRQALTERAIYRLLRDLEKEAIEVLLLSLADRLATRGPEFSEEELQRHKELVARLVKEYFHRREKLAAKKRLLTGDDLMERFGLTPGPLIGRLLAELEEAEVTGKVANKEEAFEFADKLIRDST